MATATGGNAAQGEKLEMKERNYFQMIEVLMTRLKKMEEKVDERRRACADDQNADSDFCSSMVSGMQQDLQDLDEQSRDRRGASPPRASRASRRTISGGSAHLTAGVEGEDDDVTVAPYATLSPPRPP